ncbi:MAG: BT_3928 family protein [Cytophagaceae bacterium]
MKVILQISRFLVGGLFVFSGLVKLNDPYGTSYKLEEYFEVFGQNFSSFFYDLIPYSLSLSLFIIIAEVVLGVAVLVYYRMRQTTYVLLGLILFFTFLTFYSAYFNKVTDCGCFGDFIKLTPWQSFAKDVILLVFILVLFVYRNKKLTGFNDRIADYVVGASVLISSFLGYYSLAHLPFFDFLPYSVKSNIKTNMQAEESPKFAYIMEKEGKEFIFDAIPSDTNYVYKNIIIKNPGKSAPKISDYRIWNDEGDFTDSSFTNNKLLVVVGNADKVLKSSSILDKLQRVNVLSKELEHQNVDVWVVTSSSMDEFEQLRHQTQLAIPYFYADGTVLKTMIRSNPGILLLQNGTVKGKWHINDIPETDNILKKLQ